MALKDIDTIVIVIMENRSFDHMLGYLSLPGANPPLALEGLRDDPGWIGECANACGTGRPYPLHRLRPEVQDIDDPPHEMKTIDLQINTPPYPGSPLKMGGFVQSYTQRDPAPTDRSLVMGYYDQAAVPVFDFFARHFAVCDHWFAALPTGTQANRLMAMSGQSSIVDNAAVFLPSQDLVYDWLEQHGVSWCAYQSGDFLPFFSLMPDWLPEIVSSLTLSELGARGRFRRYSKFREHWSAGAAMPSVIFVEPEYTDGPHADPNDDHAPTGVAKGQLFLADLYDSLTANPARWSRTLMVVTYDEHGGFFDHVPPLDLPTSIGGTLLKTTGVRVPAFLIGPQLAPGSVLHEAYDHTSILQLLADRFHAGQTYSSAVAQRQARLGRLAAALDRPAVPAAPAPALPAAALQALRAATVAAPAGSPVLSASATANSQALHNAALKAAKDHPDLIREPAWAGLAGYLDHYA